MFLAAVFAAALLAGPDDRPIRGTVVDEGARPVAGATVLLTGAVESGGQATLSTTTTDDQGRFSIQRPESLDETAYPRPRLWAWAPGRGLNSTGFRGPIPGPGVPVVVALGPVEKAEIRVLKPDGSPAVGAQVRVTALRFSESAEIPDAFRDRASATADADGLATFDAFANDKVAQFEAEADGFGIQPRHESPTTTDPKTIALRPVGRLEGRLVADDPAFDFRGWKVSATTHFSVKGPGEQGSGRGTSKVGPDGRFLIPELAEGRISYWIDWPDDSAVLPVFSSLATTFDSGRPNAVEIPLRTATVVVGKVAVKGNGTPIAGVKLFYYRPGENSATTIRTDAQGRYRVISLGGKARIWLNSTDVPQEYVGIPDRNLDNLEIPPGPGRFEIDPIELRRAAAPLRGIVRDEEGKPAPGASITYVWSETNDRGLYQSHGRTSADEMGAFLIRGVPEKTAITIKQVRLGDRISAGTLTAKAGQTEDLAIRIDRSGTVAIAGRVLDGAGVPLPNAEVRLEARLLVQGQFPTPMPVDWDAERSTLRTNIDGTFRSPKALRRRGAEYRAVVTAPGYQAGESSWTPSGDGPVALIADIRLAHLARALEIAGKVQDQGGKPIPGARVYQSGNGVPRSETQADNAGGFRLGNAPDRSALVFAEAPGYRLGGAILGENVVIRLDREGDPPPTPEGNRPPLSRAEERAIARDLLEPLLPLARAGKLETEGDRVIPALARVDPDRVLTMIEDRTLSNHGPALIQVALARFEESDNAAIATIEADRDPNTRAAGFLAIAALVPRTEPDRRGGFLDRATAEARLVASKQERIKHFETIIDGWLALGRLDQARALIAEARDSIAKPPKNPIDSYSEEFGEYLGLIDLPAARDLFEQASKRVIRNDNGAWLDRHLGRLATRLATADPAEAERLIRNLRPRPQHEFSDREEIILRSCRAMAVADLPRARGLLDTLDAVAQSDPRILRATGLGRMADALAESDPASARSLLDEAVSTLLELSDRAKGNATSPEVSACLAALLPATAKVDPDRARERAWLAASRRAYREPAPVPQLALDRERKILNETATVAIRVAPIDRTLALAIASPVFERLPSLAVEPDDFNGDLIRLFRAVAVLDARRLAPILDALPGPSKTAREDTNGNRRVSLDARARIASAEVLGLPPSARARAALGFREPEG